MAKRTAPPPPPTHVSRDDLERGFLSIQRGVKREIADRRSTLITIAGGVGVALAVIVFLVGRRSGKKKTTYVEIRRV